MNNFMPLIKYFFLSVIIVGCAIALRMIFDFNNEKALPSSFSAEKRCIIIDAGHGGKDGGAISVTGTMEKELNLEVSLNIKEVLTVLGYDIILTRESDVELKHESGGTRKMQDLKGRLMISEINPDVPFVSIHMNKFPVQKYSGLQVYYSLNNDSSKSLADTIRCMIKDYLQNDNERAIKPAHSNIYLLHNINSPAVLIECGFISNDVEAERLDDHIYRMKLSNIIASAINLWYNNNNIN